MRLASVVGLAWHLSVLFLFRPKLVVDTLALPEARSRAKLVVDTLALPEARSCPKCNPCFAASALYIAPRKVGVRRRKVGVRVSRKQG